jgi:heme A synthase
MLAFHRTGAVTTAVVALIVTAAALADRRLGRAPVWPVFVSAALFVAEAAQIMVGYYHVLAVHIPLGVSIISSLVLLVAWAWQPPTARQRRPAAATPAASGAASLNSSATSAPM